DVPLAKIDLIWGDSATTPYSVGESGSRTTIMTGQAVVEAAQNLKKQIAQKGMPKGDEVLTAAVQTTPNAGGGRVRNAFGAHFVEVTVDTELGRVKVEKFLAIHDCGRIINPLTAESQIKGGAQMGIGMALHEDLLYDRRSGVPLTPGYYGARMATHCEAVDVDVVFIESDGGPGPYGATSMGERS